MKLSLGRRDDARVNLLWGKLRAAAELTFGARERRDNPGFERLPGSLSYGVCRQMTCDDCLGIHVYILYTALPNIYQQYSMLVIIVTVEQECSMMWA